MESFSSLNEFTSRIRDITNYKGYTSIIQMQCILETLSGYQIQTLDDFSSAKYELNEQIYQKELALTKQWDTFISNLADEEFSLHRSRACDGLRSSLSSRPEIAPFCSDMARQTVKSTKRIYKGFGSLPQTPVSISAQQYADSQVSFVAFIFIASMLIANDYESRLQLQKLVSEDTPVPALLKEELKSVRQSVLSNNMDLTFGAKGLSESTLGTLGYKGTLVDLEYLRSEPGMQACLHLFRILSEFHENYIDFIPYGQHISISSGRITTKCAYSCVSTSFISDNIIVPLTYEKFDEIEGSKPNTKRTQSTQVFFENKVQAPDPLGISIIPGNGYETNHNEIHRLDSLLCGRRLYKQGNNPNFTTQNLTTLVNLGDSVHAVIIPLTPQLWGLYAYKRVTSLRNFYRKPNDSRSFNRNYRGKNNVVEQGAEKLEDSSAFKGILLSTFKSRAGKLTSIKAFMKMSTFINLYKRLKSIRDFESLNLLLAG